MNMQRKFSRQKINACARIVSKSEKGKSTELREKKTERIFSSIGSVLVEQNAVHRDGGRYCKRRFPVRRRLLRVRTSKKKKERRKKKKNE